MNATKLYVGQTFKNYKEMCIGLELEFKNNTKGKKYQFRDIERYCKLHKDGQKIIIDDVFETPLPQIDGRKGGNNSIYNNYIQVLILDLLAQNNEGHISISKSKLLKTLAMTNINYGYCSVNVPKLAKYINTTEEIVYDYYTTSNSTFYSAMKIALKSLEDKKIILLEKVLKVCQLNNETRLAKDVEKTFILETEKSIMKEMGYKQESHLREDGMYPMYKNKVDNVVCTELKIRYYYPAYDITINQKYIEEELNDLLDLLLEEDTRKENKDKLNETVREHLLKNATERHDKWFSSKKKGYFRRLDSYVDTINELNDLLIDNQQDNLINQLSKVKVSPTITEKELDDLFC